MRRMVMQIIFILLAVICIIYGFLVLGTGSGTSFFAVWFALGIIFIAAAGVLAFHVWEKIPKAIQMTGTVVILFVAVIFVIVEIMIAGSFSEKGEKDLTHIIVLGAQVKENGPSVVLKYRLDAAYDYLIENTNTVCIVSGGQGPNEPFAEAEGMKQYLEKRGIESYRIIMEDRSLNTVQNIENSISFFDPQKDQVGILTNNFHVFRAVKIAKKAGIQNPHGIAAYSSPLYLPNNMLREFFGLLKDFLAGNI